MDKAKKIIKSDVLPYQNLGLKDMDGEEWRSCYGYDGLYEVSNMGRVKSIYRTVNRKDGREMKIQARMLKQATGKKKKKCKYLFVGLSNEGVHTTQEVHRLVGLAFLPPSNKSCIVHEDHNTIDNRSKNLKWATYEEKSQQARDIGYHVSSNTGNFGGNSFGAKKITMLDIKGDFKMNFNSRIEAASWLIENGLAPKQELQNIISSINKAAIGKYKMSYGHKWKNQEKDNV